jgi:hypothetical protein
VLLKNSSVHCLYSLTLPLVGVCALSIHQRRLWKCWGARYLSEKYGKSYNNPPPQSSFILWYCLVHERYLFHVWKYCPYSDSVVKLHSMVWFHIVPFMRIMINCVLSFAVGTGTQLHTFSLSPPPAQPENYASVARVMLIYVVLHPVPLDMVAVYSGTKLLQC